MSKINFLNNIILFSLSLILISLFLSFFVVPFTQDKARSYIRSSNLDFFPSLIKPKRFIDTVENLTVFLDKKENQKIEKIILKDTSNSQNIQIIISKNGEIINNNGKKYLILNDGKIINTNLEKKSTIFDFKETNFDLGKYQTKTTTKAKIQEVNSFNIFNCLKGINKDTSDDYTLTRYPEFKNFDCKLDIKKELSQEFYKRTYLPFYILLITITVSFLVLNPHINNEYKSKKIKIFLIGIFLVVFSEISINLISDNNLRNLVILLILPTLIFVSYFIFTNKVKTSS